jgi:hypothetical protein
MLPVGESRRFVQKPYPFARTGVQKTMAFLYTSELPFAGNSVPPFSSWSPPARRRS